MNAGERKKIFAERLAFAGLAAILIGELFLLRGVAPGELAQVDVMKLSMDFFAMVLGCILFAAGIKDRGPWRGMKLLFTLEVVVIFLGLALGAGITLLEGHLEYTTLGIVLETVLYMTQPVTTFVYVFYVLEYMEIREERAAKVSLVVLLVTGVASLLVCLSNLFYPVYFRFDEAGMYQRQPLYLLSNAYTILGGVITLGLIVKYHKRIRVYQRIILVAFLLAPLLAMMANMVRDGLQPIYPTTMAALLIIYSVLNVEKNRERSALEAELSIANMIQDALLPDLMPDSRKAKEYDLYATMDPAREVGGDFYDFFMVDDHTLAFLVADVSDKGVGAALFMAVSKAVIKMRAQMGGSPGEVLTDVDERMSKNNDAMMFVTVWLGYLDLKTGHVVAANAGHDFPALMLSGQEAGKSAEYTIDEETEHGTPIACQLGFPFPEVEFDMKPGDKVFLYTDGVSEARGSRGEEYGLERLLKTLNANRSADARALCRAVKASVDTFVGDAAQFDDMTMLALTFEGYC